MQTPYVPTWFFLVFAAGGHELWIPGCPVARRSDLGFRPQGLGGWKMGAGLKPWGVATVIFCGIFSKDSDVQPMDLGDTADSPSAHFQPHFRCLDANIYDGSHGFRFSSNLGSFLHQWHMTFLSFWGLLCSVIMGQTRAIRPILVVRRIHPFSLGNTQCFVWLRVLRSPRTKPWLLAWDLFYFGRPFTVHWNNIDVNMDKHFFFTLRQNDVQIKGF